jgi:hypothetical protein
MDNGETTTVILPPDCSRRDGCRAGMDSALAAALAEVGGG